MAASDIQRVLEKVSELERRFQRMSRHGTVEEVKNGYIRIKYHEKGADGKPVFSPRLPQSDTHFGNMRAEIPFKKGQNVTVFSPTGDPAQATVLPFSPQDKIRRPKHAVDEQATGQWGQRKHAEDENLNRMWVEEEEDDGPEKGPLDEKGEKDDESSSRAMVRMRRDPETKKIQTYIRTGKAGDAEIIVDKDKITVSVGGAKVVITASEITTEVGSGHTRTKDGHVKGWVGSNMFVAASAGAKIKAGGSYYVAIPGKLIVSQPPVIGGDPIPDN